MMFTTQKTLNTKRMSIHVFIDHINEKKKTSMIKLECNTTNFSLNEEEEDWDLVSIDQFRDKTSRKHQMKMTLVDGVANFWHSRNRWLTNHEIRTSMIKGV